MISEQQIAGLLEQLPDATVVVRKNGTMVLVNGQAERLFGYEREQLLGEPVEMLLPESFRAKHTQQRAEYSGNPRVRPMGAPLDLVARDSDGTVFPADISLSPMKLDGEMVVLASIRNTSVRKQMETELRDALAEVERLKMRLEAENAYLREEIKIDRDFEEIVGRSATLRDRLQAALEVATTDATVLILGETGTGKELLARAIHGHSGRSTRPLVKVDCAALPSTLVESELFGHEKGAFTGAVAARLGRFELADGGTIFLDEIGELSPELQPKLLRVLEEGEFERIGSSETLKVDVRVIAATNRNLEKAVGDGSFRQDLYYRLNVFPVELPPLRDRREDIPLLLWFFIKKHEGRLGKTIDKILDEDMHMLSAYDWPGNIREFEHIVERGMILSSGSTLKLDRTLKQNGSKPIAGGGTRTVNELERDHILKIVEECGWRLKGEGNAAEQLGLKPSTLRYRMRKLGITRPEING